MNCHRAAILFALLSPVFNICVLVWMSSRPPQYFHDQGGLRVLFLYFPLTLGVWLISALLSAIFGFCCPRQGPGSMSRDLRWIIRMLMVAGLCLSLLTWVVR
jgi:hypothetical protein